MLCTNITHKAAFPWVQAHVPSNHPSGAEASAVPGAMWGGGELVSACLPLPHHSQTGKSFPLNSFARLSEDQKG